VTLGNGMTSNYEYDGRNRLNKIEYKDGTSRKRLFDYRLDDMGNITKDYCNYWAYWKHEYDDRYRLTKTERYNSSDVLQRRYTYTYDDGDNRLSKVIYTPGDPATTDTYVYQYNDANELTKQTLTDTSGTTDTLFFYDSWGRMISKDQGDYGANYEYRYGDKLYKITSNFPLEADVTYEYGADGKRRSRDTSSSYTWYNWAGGNVINEESSGNTLERTYVHDPGNAANRILAHATGSTLSNWRYYLEDILGSTRGLNYHNKGYAGGTRYAPYGAVQNQTGSWNTSYMFTGQDWDDDAQMYFFPFRYYSPGIGRWMTRDPLGLVARLNLYAYVAANPVNFSDPLGLYEWSAWREEFVSSIDDSLWGIGYGIAGIFTPQYRQELWEEGYQVGVLGQAERMGPGWHRAVQISLGISTVATAGAAFIMGAQAARGAGSGLRDALRSIPKPLRDVLIALGLHVLSDYVPDSDEPRIPSPVRPAWEEIVEDTIGDAIVEQCPPHD